MKGIRHQEGFSLIEVMFAILILGVALVGFVQGVTTALGSSKDSELQTTAALLASGKIEELRADGWLEDGETDGDCGEGFPNYQWKQTITSTTIKGLHQIDLAIENSKTGVQICELHTMLFEPYVAEDLERKGNRKDDKSRQKRRGSEQ